MSIWLDVAPERINLDHGLTGTDRDRPGLRDALAVLPRRDVLVAAKLDRLTRSVPAARAIADELTNPQRQAQHRRIGLRPHRPVGVARF